MLPLKLFQFNCKNCIGPIREIQSGIERGELLPSPDPLKSITHGFEFEYISFTPRHSQIGLSEHQFVLFSSGQLSPSIA